jgi:mono/diheme cytochrome c family protein
MRHSAIAILALVAAAILPPHALPAAPEDQGQEEAPARTAGPLVIPAAERDRKNPVPAVPEAIEAGRVLFTSQCAMCHGVRADGRGDLAAELKLAVPNLADPKRQAKRTDGEWFYIIGHGHRGMPAEKRLADQQKWEMILYLRGLVPPKGKP